MLFTFLFGTRRSSLGVLTLDVLLTEKIRLPGTVTRYPVEDGTETSDHIGCGSRQLHISGSVSHSAMLEFGLRGVTRLMDAVEALEHMHEQRQPITVVTGLGVYEDMGIESLEITRAAGEKGGNWIDIDAELVRIERVSLKQADIPPGQAAPDAQGKAGQTGQRAGQSPSQNPATPQQDTRMRSTLATVAQPGG